ncbi:MAG: fatty acid desaturase [Bacteroidota bacterium]
MIPTKSALAPILANKHTGVFIGILIILLWAISLVLNFIFPVVWTNPLTYLRILIQAHLFTGLFITAHDAMHGVVAPRNAKLNHLLGKIASALFIFNEYKKLRPKHYDHHRFAGTDKDPDFHRGKEGFFYWYLDFLKEYISWKQVILAAISFNIAKIWVAEPNLILYWVIASLLGTIQLFYFGTYLPHKGEHDNSHHSRSQKKNHLWAFISCYFFGYHLEHHDSPATPWWLLWTKKELKEIKTP